MSTIGIISIQYEGRRGGAVGLFNFSSIKLLCVLLEFMRAKLFATFPYSIRYRSLSKLANLLNTFNSYEARMREKEKLPHFNV